MGWIKCCNRNCWCNGGAGSFHVYPNPVSATALGAPGPSGSYWVAGGGGGGGNSSATGGFGGASPDEQSLCGSRKRN